MTIALLVIADGRDEYLRQCIASLSDQHLVPGDGQGPIGEGWLHDDTGDEQYRAELAARYPAWRHINNGPRLGCAAAFQSAWSQVDAGTKADHIFMVEQDFIFPILPRPVPLAGMVAILDEHPYLAQVALRRQAWSHEEIVAGGVVEQHPELYVDLQDELGRQWLEHTAFWTTNPCVFRRSLLGVGWPDYSPERYSESTFHMQLMAAGTPEVTAGQVRYAYWGSRDSGVWTVHIGHMRAGVGY